MDEYDNDFEDDLSDVSSINGQPPHELQESSSFLENRSRTGTPTVEASNGPIASEKTSHSVHKNHGLKSDKRTPYKKSNLSLSNLGNRTASNSLTKLKTKPPNTTGTRYNKQRKTSIGNSMSMPAFEELMRLQSVIDSQKTLIAQLEDERKTLKIVNQRQEREIQRLMKEQGEWPRLLRVQAEEVRVTKAENQRLRTTYAHLQTQHSKLLASHTAVRGTVQTLQKNTRTRKVEDSTTLRSRIAQLEKEVQQRRKVEGELKECVGHIKGAKSGAMRRVEENVKSLQKELENGRERERTLKERLEEREKECAVLRIYAGRRASNGTVLQPTDGTEAAANDTRRVPLGRKRVVSYPVGGKHAVRRGISKMRHPNVAGATEKVGGESSTRHKESDIEIKQETDYEELPDETLTVPQSPQEDAPPQLKEVDNKEKQFQSHQPAASTKALVIPRKQQQAEMTDQNDENEFGLNKFATTTTDPAPSTFHKPNLFGPPPTEDLIARYSNPNLNEDKRLRDGAQQDKEDRYESDFHSDDGAQPAASPPHTAQPLRDLPNPTARPVGSVTGVAATSQPFLSGTPFNHKVAVEPLVESRVYQQSPNEVASSYQAISKPKSPYFLGSSKAINGSPALNDMYVPSASSASTQFQSPRGSREALGKPLWLKG